MDIKGKVGLVTGSSTGIGLEYVTNLLKKGAKNVSICDVDVKNGEAASKKLNEEFGAGKTIFIKTDVTNKAEIDAAFKKTYDTFRGLDIVINNAGILNDGAWEKEIAININAVVYGTLLAFEYMGKHRGRQGGVVINIASILGLDAIAGCPVYVATKHAVVGFVRAYGLPFHFNKTGVRVMGMCPGVTDTPLISEAHARQGTDEMGVECQRELDSLEKQKPSHVANDMMMMIEKGENGGLYVSEGGVPAFKVKFTPRQQMK